MLIVLAVLSTIFSIVSLTLLKMVNEEDYKKNMSAKIVENINVIEKLMIKKQKQENIMLTLDGIALKIKKIFTTNYDKEIENLNSINAQIKQGETKYISILLMPGFVLMRKIETLTYNKIYLNIYTLCVEVYGKKFAKLKATQTVATIISILLFAGIGIFIFTTMLVASGNINVALMVFFGGVFLVFLISYAMYDELKDKATKRRDDINRELPQVLSKMAILVTSGMSMSNAWEEIAYSKNGQVYIEMQKTSEQLNNLMSIQNAFGDFANRCNTKSVSKLTTSIIQSSSKGNKEVAILLKNMSSEAWNERKHIAKRDSEKANAKLLIPTMLLLGVVLFMIMVPIGMSMNGI